jgi:hypothetical protein
MKELNLSYFNGGATSQEEILQKFNGTTNKLYTALSTPLLSLVPLREGQPANQEVINTMFNETAKDLDVIFNEFADLRDRLATNFNTLSIQARRVRGLGAKILSDLNNYLIQNSNLDVFLLMDTFKTTEKIENDKQKYKEEMMSHDYFNDMMTLPIADTDEKQYEIVKINLGKHSTGIPGNNQEIGSLGRNNIQYLIDGNLDTWFEYERVTEKNPENPLVLELELTIKNESIFNVLEMSLTNFPNGKNPYIAKLEGSFDGQIYTDLIQDYLGVKKRIADGTEVIELSGEHETSLEKYSLLFSPRKIKYLRITVVQDSAYYIRTPSMIKNRLAIGIKEISIKGRKFKNKGELITTSLTVPGTVEKISLEEKSHFPTGFDGSINYSVSPDDGQTWHDIQPTGTIGNGKAEVLSFNIDNVDSIKTPAAVTSIKLRAVAELKQPAKTSVSSSYKVEREKTEIKTIGNTTKRIELEKEPSGAVRLVNVGFGSVGQGIFYTISHNDIQTRDDGVYLHLPLEVFSRNSIKEDSEIVYSESFVWKRVDSLDAYGAGERVYEFDYINNIAKFASIFNGEKHGKTPTEPIQFKLKRENGLVSKADKNYLSTRFSNDGIKESIKIYKLESSIKEQEMIILPKNNVIPLSVTEIQDVEIVNDETQHLKRSRDYINGYSELSLAGDYSIDKESGVLYLYDSIPDTSSAKIKIKYKTRIDMGFALDNTGKIYLTDSQLEETVNEKTISVPIAKHAISLGVENIIKGSIEFIGGSTDFVTELEFNNGLEFINIQDVTKPYSIDYRRGLLFVPEKYTGEFRVKFNSIDLYVEYNIAKEVMKTEYKINRTEKYIELSDDYVMKFFASSAASLSNNLFKIEYKYAEEVKEPPKDMLAYTTPLIHEYRIKAKLKEA